MTRGEFIAFLRSVGVEGWMPNFLWTSYGAHIKVTKEALRLFPSPFIVDNIEIRVILSETIISLNGTYEDIVSLMLEVDPRTPVRMYEDAQTWAREQPAEDAAKEILGLLDPLQILMLLGSTE